MTKQCRARKEEKIYESDIEDETNLDQVSNEYPLQP